MKRVCGVLMLACAVLASGADDKKDGGATKETKKLEGTWTLISSETDGRQEPADDVKDIKAVIKGNKMTISHRDKVTVEHTFSIDPVKTPKTIDLTVTSRTNKGTKRLGIYELDGDKLNICVSEAQRPNKFTTKRGSQVNLIVFKRAKK